MKKLFTILALTAVLALAIAPAAMAQTEIPDSCTLNKAAEKALSGGEACPATGPCNVEDNPICGLCCTLETIYTVTNWIFFLMMTLAVVLIVIGGAIYMTSGGDPAKAGKGKTIITYAIIGLVIALVARFIPAIVKFILGVS